MPIKKRTTFPPAPTIKHRRPSTVGHYKLPGRPLSDILKEHDQQASDAAWAGKPREAQKQTKLADAIRNRLQAGELYEVDH